MTIYRCDSCNREFVNHYALRQHCKAKKHEPFVFMSAADAADIFDDGESMAGVAIAMEAAGYDDMAEFLMDAARAEEELTTL